jgi:uncharacterized protein YecE (DUF72 family)
LSTIRIGLSGWNYPAWRGDFYPDGLAHRHELSFAAHAFDTLEINGTFYSLRRPEDFRRWRAAAPKGFVYAVKGSRFLTHNKNLGDPLPALANFLASGLLELRETLGPILWQLPARLRFDAERAERFCSLLPKDTEAAGRLAARHDGRVRGRAVLTPDRNRRLRHVVEARHPSWLQPEAARVFRRHGTALAISHSSGWEWREELTAGFVYLRLHGPGRLYASAYSDARLDRWAARIRAWAAGDEPDDPCRITDRAPPTRKGRDVYVYFNNDDGGHAFRDARRLRERVG